MKIIPDPVYSKMQCGATRMSYGSALVLPRISAMIPFERFAEKTSRFIMPAVIAVPVVTGFTEPRAMFAIVLVWAIAAWKLGTCPHCQQESRRTDSTPDPSDHDIGEQ